MTPLPGRRFSLETASQGRADLRPPLGKCHPRKGLPDKAHPALHARAGAGDELRQGSREVSTGLDAEQSMTQWLGPNLLESYRELPGNGSSPSFPERIIQVKPEEQGVNDPRNSTKS